ncbi:class e vacuolar protein-sorting machinery protein hse1 [Diplodia corticola]|uniref:Class E vacuolar protein-sorting machinery protein HSE1 n=1 Tax=Diplodia corticola TaxID=236234 RepID=A0A1J9QPE1_9PEZI|nr:class e vacuolar protein-sorting machinery protein hse1 [Diplodia corticola]OJD30320.1 class e vacuolar protein-sorting machinery protein hse1 [Diplodia corticola]
MFRAQANQFDDVVVRATDENLTSENWEYILDVCDKVGASDSGAKDVVAALIKRMAHRNANVQLYTLELANALSQNCGLKIHKELASRSFTDALLRLANDRNTHQQVKAKILERMGEWTEMFAKDPDLGIMEQAYMRLKTQNPNLRPPSKPQKTQITDSDRQKEEEELQMALALSVKESGTEPSAARSNQPQASAPQQPAPEQEQHQAIASGTTAATVSRVRALYDFTPSEPGELAFRKGDIIAVLESVYKDWWKGSLRGQTGIFPLNYVEKLQDPTKEELEREAQMEAEVFAEIKNVEKLLALLSTSSSADARDNEEITSLYHKTVSIRPKLIELIGKYSQKKDDFTQLNEKFIKARRDYETLLEASMSQPAQPGYGRQPYGYGAGAPPPQSAPYGGYPPQGPPPQERYYSPTPAADQGYGYPPQNGPQPFMMAQPGQAPPSAQVASPKPANGDLSYVPQRVPVGGRPTSMAFPQEMAANSPVDARPPPQQGYNAYPPQPNQAPPGVPTDPASAPGYPPQPQANRQSSYDSPSSAYPPQPPQGPSDPYIQQQPPQHQHQQSLPGAYPPSGNTPPPGQSPYIAFNQSTVTLPPAGGPSAPPPGAGGGYQAYNPNAGAAPAQRWGQPPAAMAGGGARDDADGFYR